MMANGPSPWSDDRIARLRSRAEEGASATIIAAELSQPTHHFTRNAVISKANRLRIHLTGRPTRLASRLGEPTTPAPRRPPKTAPAPGPPKEARQPKAQADPVVFYTHEPPPEPVSLQLRCEDLAARSCKWPYGHPGEPNFSFCGHATYDRLPYCEHHARRAFTCVLVRERRGSA